ncbi:hypothetical protein C9374_006057 [Naegleria lovaniensis]|uniref:Uncharacterized protein n=1 Tax=Naegleria lovaniensis TaxID=51637 RepID=A0AA88GP91_NAELO|nr:uncharacterized protein C9374_006057 [Naegleria lovaniensis]KAG2381673.1 hypothetical protein C9374_006057 [Naegleria lovaniensis]
MSSSSSSHSPSNFINHPSSSDIPSITTSSSATLLSELTQSLKSTTLSSGTPPMKNTGSNGLIESREDHKFQRIILIHLKTGVTIFDYCFPNAWNAKKTDIGGFLASCYQFDATVKGGGIRKIVFQPPSDNQTSHSSGRIIRQASGTSATTPGLNMIGSSSATVGGKLRTITPTSTVRINDNQSITTTPTSTTSSTPGGGNTSGGPPHHHHAKTNSTSSMNILSGFNTIRRRSVHHRSKRNRRTCLNFGDPMGLNSSNLMYIVFGLPNDPISPVLVSHSPSYYVNISTQLDPTCLCAVCFEGCNDLWTEIAKTFASEAVREFCTAHRDLLEKHKKNFEKLKIEANRDEELERQIVEEFQIFEELMNKTKQRVLDAFASRITMESNRSKNGETSM